MKLLTFLVAGRECVGILTRRPKGGGNIVINIECAVKVLKTQHDMNRLWWVTPWSGPWGPWIAPADMIDIARCGKPAVSALRELEDILWSCARSSDGMAVEGALVDPSRITWLAPIPEPPAFFFFHGNAAVGLNFQFRTERRRKVPHTRNRPITAVAGNGDLIPTAPDGSIKEDVELGFVTGPAARHLRHEQVMDHVFGYTVCWDGSTGLYGHLYAQRCPEKRPHHGRARANLEKSIDLNGVFGPVIVTANEVGNPHDLLGYLYMNDIRRGRGHTGALLDPIHDILELFSRVMTVQPGTLFAMGAAGFDGYPVTPDMRRPGPNSLRVEIERIGSLENRLVYPDEPEGLDLKGTSPYLWRRRRLGLPGADMPDLSPEDIPETSRQLWATHVNFGTSVQDRTPSPYCYPRSSVAPANRPIVLPVNCGPARVSVHLAGVVGTRPLYQVNREDVKGQLLGIVAIIGVQDLGFTETFANDPAEASSMFAHYMSCFGDGYHTVGQVLPSAQVSANFEKAAITLTIEGAGAARGRVSDYACDLSGLVEWITMGITLLPADLVSLGASHAEVDLPIGSRPGSPIGIRAQIEGLPPIETTIKDERDPSYPPWRGFPI